MNHLVILSGTLALALATAGCKTRQPEAAGLLDAGGGAAPVDDGGEGEGGAGAHWGVECWPRADEARAAEDVIDLRYWFDVRNAAAAEAAAASPGQGAPAVQVTVTRHSGEEVTVLAGDSPGQGLVEASGSFYIGSAAGALTCMPLVPPAGRLTHTGVLTLASDPAANGIEVGCRLAVYR